MDGKSAHQTKNTTPKPTISLSQPGILQRTCACGGVAGLTGECEECSSKRLSGQRDINQVNEQPIESTQRSPLGGYNFGQLAIQPKERWGIQTKLAIGQPGDKYEQEADRVAEKVMRLPDPNLLGQPKIAITKPLTLAIQRTEASDLIDRHTRYLDLKEDELGGELLRQAQRGNYQIVDQVLNELGSTNRDDVSYEIMRQSSDRVLQQFVQSSDGRQMLDRLYDELSAGSFSEEERLQANRIINAKESQISPSEQPESLAEIKIFPFKLPGITVFNDAPITAERRSQGRIWVRMPIRVLGTERFRRETRTLPTEVFVSGIELPENEIIGVRMYDLGGELHTRPALYLVQLANETNTQVLQSMGETAAIGLTLGSGALVAGATRGSMAVRGLVRLGISAERAASAVLWADRAAFAIGLITTAIRDHRGWIIEHFGDAGRQFLDYVDLTHRMVAIYGMARFVLEMGGLLNSLRSASRNWRRASTEAERELSSTRRQAVQDINRHTDEFLDNANQIERASSRSSSGDGTRGQARIASGTPEEPTPILRGGTLTPRHQGLLSRLAAEDDLGVGLAEVGRREVTATDLAALTRHHPQGNEYALIILRDNRRVLVDMGSYSGGALPPDTRTLLMHSHPHDWGTGMSRLISQNDVEALMILNQRYSYMVTVDGTVYRFTLETVPNTVGEVVRKFHAVLGWVSP